MKLILSLSVIMCMSVLLNASEMISSSDTNNNVSDKPTITACMNYYCCNISERCNSISSAEKITKTGKCLLATSLITKSTEFCLFTCCYPNSEVSYTCNRLWFPSCNDCCSTTSLCVGTSIDWSCTLAVLVGPIMWATGAIWKKYKQEENNLHLGDDNV